MKRRLWIPGAVALFALMGCSTVKVVASKEKLVAIKKIALLETLIEKAAVTSMSGLQQGATEAKFAAIAGELNKVDAGVVDQYRDIATKKLATELNATVLSGKQLTKAYATAENDGFKDFPVAAYKNEFSVTQASGEKNFIDAPEGEFGKHLEKADLSKLAVYFCEKLNVDAIALSFSKVVFVIQQDKALMGTGIVIYDRTGERIFSGAGAIDPPLDVTGAGDVANFTKIKQKHVYARTVDLIFAKLKEAK